MPWYAYVWSDAIVEHLAEHDITPEDFEYVLANSEEIDKSDSSGRDAVWGYTPDGRRVFAVYELLDDGMTLIPITCYEVSE